MRRRTATPERFPAPMKRKPRWLGWIWGAKRPSGRWERFDPATLVARDGHLWHVMEGGELEAAQKLPVCIRTGRAASVSDPGTWCGFQDALDAMRRGAVEGIGYVLDEYEVLLDIDGCVGADGEPDEFARALVARIDSYAEFSVSGEGVHIVAVAEGFMPDRGQKGARVECYVGGHTRRYCTVSGDVCEGHYELNIDAEDVVSDVYLAEFSHNPIVTEDDELLTRAIMDAIGAHGFDREDERAAAWACGHYRHARAMLERGDYLGWQRDREAYREGASDTSRSAADYALASYLLAATMGDNERTLAILRASGMARPKYDEIHDGRHTYAIMTVAAAARNADIDALRRQAFERRDKALAGYPGRLEGLASLMRATDVTDAMLRHYMATGAPGEIRRPEWQSPAMYPDRLIAWLARRWDDVLEHECSFALGREAVGRGR